jgi:modulator of FtsH protease HflK
MHSNTPLEGSERAKPGRLTGWRQWLSLILRERAIRASLISVSVDFTLVVIKAGLAVVTGSLALAADAYHSLTDMVVSISVLLGTVLSRAPAAGHANAADLPPTPDAKSGNPRVEAAVAVFVAVLILLIPLEILSEVRTENAQPIQYAWVGILGMLACMAIAYFVARFKLLVGRDESAPALEADGHHSHVDIFTSLAVILSLMGQFIGIELDAIVAVIIAVIIGLTGLELLFSALVGLARGGAPRHTSTWSILQEIFGRLLDKTDMAMPSHWFRLPRLNLARLHQPKILAGMSLLLLAIWLASGVTFIGPAEQGVRIHFGAIHDSALGPGMHYHLPKPLGDIERVRAGHVHRLEIGFRTDPALGKSLSSQVWDMGQMPEGYRRVEEESLMLSGDEGLVDLSLVLHYRPTDTVTHRIGIADMEAVLRALTEAQARQAMAVLPAHAAMGDERANLLRQIHADLSAEATRLKLGVKIISVHAHDIRPPGVVVPAFRDVFSAREGKARLLAQGQAHRGEALPKARAERTRRLGEAEAQALEFRLHAQGDARKFEQLALAYRQTPDVTRYRLFIEAVEESLADKVKIIADARVNRGEYRHWLLAPDQAPKQTLPHNPTRGSR